VLVGVFIASLVLAWEAAQRARRTRFMAREVLPADVWFRTYLPDAGVDQAALTKVLALLGDEIGTDWTRFRPDDRFSVEFSYRGVFRWTMGGSELDWFSGRLDNWLHARGLTWPWDQAMPDRLIELLAALQRLLAKAREDSQRATTVA
jgi:hypothetical protein